MYNAEKDGKDRAFHRKLNLSITETIHSSYLIDSRNFLLLIFFVKPIRANTNMNCEHVHANTNASHIYEKSL